MSFKERLDKLLLQLDLRRQIKKLRTQGEQVKVVVGAGPTSYERWLMTDLPIFNALRPLDWYLIFPRRSIDRILAEHVIEHWSEDQFCSFLNIARLFLVGRGFVRIAVPDGFHPDSAYIDQVRPGGSGGGADDHKILYNYLVMAQLLTKMQYNYEFLEYFDETGVFHRIAWIAGDGFVQRSADYDVRNREVPLTYTSLIVDAWPNNL